MSNTFFDQRGQHVQYQYNAAGNINFGTAQSPADVVPLLQKLLDELTKASQSNALDPEQSEDAQSNIRKALIQAKKPQPDGPAMVGYLDTARGIIDKAALTATSLVGLAGGLKEAAAVVARLFA